MYLALLAALTATMTDLNLFLRCFGSTLPAVYFLGFILSRTSFTTTLMRAFAIAVSTQNRS
jgi:hypothetical protein